ncbi:MAG: peptide chain release factor 1 [Endomicrobium sp.]|jgi:peptide chain release factor 1|nr:peptide chain release factor 1 [Endomicrobium sp.]
MDEVRIVYLKKLKSLDEKFTEIEKKFCDLSIISNQEKYKKNLSQYYYLNPIVKKYRQYLKLLNDIYNTEGLKKSNDIQIRELAIEECNNLIKLKNNIESEINFLIVQLDSNDNQGSCDNIIVEIRAGIGGDEAALFVNDLYKMYIRFAEKNGWKYDILNSNFIGIGGYKEIIFEINGKNIWNYFKFERGIHRVQRVPETEVSGRIHTSAATVAVFKEVKEVDVEIKMEELRIDSYRASGAGGQHVNKTNSAIRITHLPTGIVVACQDERSQTKNKIKVFKILRAKLYDKKKSENMKKISNERRLQIGSGDRSEKIRTYNYQQNRITDHRIVHSIYDISEIMSGNLMKLISKLIELEVESKINENII